VSSADLAFDQPLKGVPRPPEKTSASFARWRASWTSPRCQAGLFSLATSSGNELARSHKLKTVYFSLLSISASV